MRKNLISINKINESNLDSETKVIFSVLLVIGMIALGITILVSSFTDDSEETHAETDLTTQEYPISTSEIQSWYGSDDFCLRLS